MTAIKSLETFDDSTSPSLPNQNGVITHPDSVISYLDRRESLPEGAAVTLRDLVASNKDLLRIALKDVVGNAGRPDEFSPTTRLIRRLEKFPGTKSSSKDIANQKKAPHAEDVLRMMGSFNPLSNEVKNFALVTSIEIIWDKFRNLAEAEGDIEQAVPEFFSYNATNSSRMTPPALTPPKLLGSKDSEYLEFQESRYPDSGLTEEIEPVAEQSLLPDLTDEFLMWIEEPYGVEGKNILDSVKGLKSDIEWVGLLGNQIYLASMLESEPTKKNRLSDVAKQLFSKIMESPSIAAYEDIKLRAAMTLYDIENAELVDELVVSVADSQEKSNELSPSATMLQLTDLHRRHAQERLRKVSSEVSLFLDARSAAEAEVVRLRSQKRDKDAIDFEDKMRGSFTEWFELISIRYESASGHTILNSGTGIINEGVAGKVSTARTALVHEDMPLDHLGSQGVQKEFPGVKRTAFDLVLIDMELPGSRDKQPSKTTTPVQVKSKTNSFKTISQHRKEVAEEYATDIKVVVLDLSLGNLGVAADSIRSKTLSSLQEI